MSVHQKKEYRDLTKLKPWAKNPKAVTEKNLNRLKAQIKELGEYKPLLIDKDNVVLGGNQRLKAYKALGFKKVWVSVVHPKDDNERLKYAISDNDAVGDYQEDALKELMEGLNTKTFKNFSVNLGTNVTLDKFMKVQEQIDQSLEIDDSDQADTLQNSIQELKLYFEPKTYEIILERLQAVMDDYDIESQTEAFVKLLEFYEANNYA